MESDLESGESATEAVPLGQPLPPYAGWPNWISSARAERLATSRETDTSFLIDISIEILLLCLVVWAFVSRFVFSTLHFKIDFCEEGFFDDEIKDDHMDNRDLKS